MLIEQSRVVKLFMIVVGGQPKGRHTEQHDVFFGIASELVELYPAIDKFWPDVAGDWHIDSWREVNFVDQYTITVVSKDNSPENVLSEHRLYFINLGGYKENDMEEYHYKILSVSSNKSDAVAAAKQTAFYKHVGFKGAPSHIDDKYSIDVDDLHDLQDILPSDMKERYQLIITPTELSETDVFHIGYVKP